MPTVRSEIEGVGAYIAGRLRTYYNIRTIDGNGTPQDIGLSPFVQQIIDAPRPRIRIDLTKMVNEVTLNARGGECMEGYVVRRHNFAGRVALINWIADNFPGLTELDLPPLRDVSRNPNNATYDRLILTYEGGWPYPDGKPSQRALANPNAPPATYPYGRNDYKQGERIYEERNRARRNALIRSNITPESNRRYWPCSCFRHSMTCADFDVRWQNRRGSGLPYCKWVAGTCLDDPDAEPPRRPVTRSITGRNGRQLRNRFAAAAE